jgi:hypothetical protein
MEKQEQKGGQDAGILYEVSGQERDQESKVDRDEEWQAGHTGRVPRLRHQGIPHRQGVDQPYKSAPL